MGATDSVATLSIDGGSLVGETKTGMPCRGIKPTTYAQLSPPSPTGLFTTYCGSGEQQVQILGTQPDMSTRIQTIRTGFFGRQKIPKANQSFPPPGRLKFEQECGWMRAAAEKRPVGPLNA
jgi:hypothetical protein